jgi:hypothetical protein
LNGALRSSLCGPFVTSACDIHTHFRVYKHPWTQVLLDQPSPISPQAARAWGSNVRIDARERRGPRRDCTVRNAHRCRENEFNPTRARARYACSLVTSTTWPLARNAVTASPILSPRARYITQLLTTHHSRDNLNPKQRRVVCIAHHSQTRLFNDTGATSRAASLLSCLLLITRKHACLCACRNDKAYCIVSSSNGFNRVTDAGGDRVLLPVEEERLLGFPEGYTAVEGFINEQRHALLGNSFSIPVVTQVRSMLVRLGMISIAAHECVALLVMTLHARARRIPSVSSSLHA